MKISEVCVQRPVFATVLSLVMMLLGVVSYERLTVREYPNIDEPVVSVTTEYPGASAEIIESQVTQVIEGSLAGVEGIDVMESTSRPETSRISIRFRTEVNPDIGASDVRDRVGRVRGQLPDEIDEPIIQKVEADAQAIMYMAFTSDSMSPIELTDYIDRYVIDRFTNLTGVADVQIFGERRYAMRIWVDKTKLAAYDLTVQDVEDALRGQNIEVPSGRVESRDREFTVLSRTGLTTPEEFEQIVIKQADGYLVRLGEVANAALGAEDNRRLSWFNGETSVSVGIIKQAVANPLDVSNAVRDELPQMLEDLPSGMNATIAYDQAVFIDRSIKAVFQVIAEAIVFVVLIIFFFLRSLRATLIPIVTIPVSLITTFAIMYALGFTVNTLTLLSLVLAIGLVVDDAIVVMENVHRHVEMGKPPKQAAIIGTKEIGFAVVAMTLTLLAVYAPVAFAPGRTGRLFVEFALTLAGAVAVSGFVALTLSPMMCSKLLKHRENHGRVYNALERFFQGMNSGYRALLRGALKARWLIVLMGAGVGGASYFLFMALPSELSPTEDRGVVQARGEAPEGSTIEFTSRYARQIEGLYADVPEIEGFFIVAGFPEVTRAISFARLKDWDERERSQQEIVEELTPKMATIPGASLFVTNPPSLGQRGGNRPMQFVLQTSGTYQELQEHVNAMLARIAEYPGMINVNSDLALNQPQLEVVVNREKILESGLQVETIGRTLETMLGGRAVTRFEREGEQYDVIVQLADAERATPQDLDAIYVRASEGAMIQLSNLVEVRETVAPKELKRFNQLRSATINANLAPGVSLGDALTFMDNAAAEVLPSTILTDLDGQSREFRSSGSSLYFVFVLALMFIYLVLAAQFESFLDPVIIMLSVPLSITGALLALYLTGNSLNVYSQIGLVTLIGLITKHGILIVEFSNQLQEQGKTKVEAVVEASELRLRPILMTALTMILGSIPLALAHGAGAESRQTIGWVIVGGMTIGTFFTLFVVPTVYAMLARQRTDESRETGSMPHPAPAE